MRPYPVFEKDSNYWSVQRSAFEDYLFNDEVYPAGNGWPPWIKVSITPLQDR